MPQKEFQAKIIVITGPTASGKTALSIQLGFWLNSAKTKRLFGIGGSEIISADSRQVYKGMDIGTGKITKKEMAGIPHHLLDVVSPQKRFTFAQYKNLAEKELKGIIKKKKIPIICGGSYFYIKSLIDGLVIPKVKPDWQLRKKLDKKTAQQLYKMLVKTDPQRAKTIDQYNKRRLIRALEICLKIKGPVPELKTNPLPYPVLILGVTRSPQTLKKLIKKRLLKRLEEGMAEEVQKLHQSGLSWQKLEDFGLEYRFLARYLQKRITYQEMVQTLEKEIWHFAKRQITWFRKDLRINWVKNYIKAKTLTKDFLKTEKSKIEMNK